MSADEEVPFETRYESRDGLTVRLDAAPRTGANGRSYTHHRLVVADGRAGAAILATRGQEVLLVRSYRASVGRDLWELPRGAGDLADRDADPSEPELVTGVRELREETGYTATRARLIGRYVVDSTVFPQGMGVVRCEIGAGVEPEETDGEVSEVRWFTDVEVRRLIREGVIADANSLSGLAIWLAADGGVEGFDGAEGLEGAEE